jgi:hypothetical protein
MKIYKSICLAITLLIPQATHAQTPIQLRDWVGKYPISRDKSFGNFFHMRQLSPKLRKLVGTDYYRRITFDNNCATSPITLVVNYLIVRTCEAHNCVSKQSFMAINLSEGDIHLALYNYGSLDWFHTKGVANDLPRDVQEEFDRWMPSTPKVKVKEITRGAI